MISQREKIRLEEREIRPLPLLAPREIFTKMFLQRIRGVLCAPAIIRTSPESYDDVKKQISSMGLIVRCEMRLFNMIALNIPTSAVNEIAGIPGVLKVYYNQDVGVPEFPISYTESFPLTLIDTERLQRLPFFQRGFREDKLVDVVPTSVSRKVVEADIADSVGVTGTGVKIAVIDTGVSHFNPQTAGIPCKTITTERKDSSGHSTHCISTAVGSEATYNGLVCVGVAPGAKVSALAIKALSTPIGMGKSSDIIKAMEYAFLEGCKVVSMSLGSSECQSTEPDCVGCPTCEAVKTLTDAGIIVVVAAGNSGEGGTIGCPGCSPSALTVGAIDSRTGELADFSSRGPTHDGRVKPDVVAPGVDILSGTSYGSLCDMLDRRPTGYCSISGTSMATPHVAGLCCLIVEMFNNAGYEITTDDIKSIIEKNANYIKDNSVGWGVPEFSFFQKCLEEQKQ